MTSKTDIAAGIAETCDTRSVLMVAYNYPPLRGSSGLQRTLKFSRSLSRFGWRPIILTANPRAYPATSLDLVGEIPADVIVKRAFAADAQKHLSFFGRYPVALALPDRWSSWIPGGIPSGLRLIRKHRPALIWSTSPIASAHLIGLSLAKITGLPWVADFRDPMVKDEAPSDPTVRKVRRWVEQRAFENADRVSVTTQGTCSAYQHLYPESAIEVIANGYDNDNFECAEHRIKKGRIKKGPITLLHSGVVYPSQRDPTALFSALSDLKNQGEISPGQFQIILRSTGNDELLREMVTAFGVAGIVKLKPPLDYIDALAEMMQTDGLLLLQASNCNDQIPAKLYEYLRAQTPILALTDPAGDSAVLMKNCGLNAIARLDDSEDIKRALLAFIAGIRRDEVPVADKSIWEQFSREWQTKQLASLFNRVIQERKIRP